MNGAGLLLKLRMKTVTLQVMQGVIRSLLTHFYHFNTSLCSNGTNGETRRKCHHL